MLEKDSRQRSKLHTYFRSAGLKNQVLLRTLNGKRFVVSQVSSYLKNKKKTIVFGETNSLNCSSDSYALLKFTSNFFISLFSDACSICLQILEQSCPERKTRLRTAHAI